VLFPILGVKHESLPGSLSKPVVEPSHSLLKCTVCGKFHLLDRKISSEGEAMFNAPVEINLIRYLEIR
jgi:hypothetical protein